jgi:hypothetical protein
VSSRREPYNPGTQVKNPLSQYDYSSS